MFDEYIKIFPFLNNVQLLSVTAVVIYCKNWMHVIISRVFGLPISKIKFRKNGIIFLPVDNKIDSNYLSFLSEIWMLKCYNPPFFSIEPKDTVFDVGANCGFFSIFAAQHATEGKVYSFEPLPKLFQTVKRNVEANKLNNVSVNNLAISDKIGKVNFFKDVTNSGGHSLYCHKNCDSKGIQVDTLTLEEFCKRNNIGKIDFLKMDCEGAEYNIMYSINKQFLKTHIKKIAMEYHTNFEFNHTDLVKFLRENDFLVEEREWFMYALNKNFL